MTKNKSEPCGIPCLYLKYEAVSRWGEVLQQALHHVVAVGVEAKSDGCVPESGDHKSHLIFTYVDEFSSTNNMACLPHVDKTTKNTNTLYEIERKPLVLSDVP